MKPLPTDEPDDYVPDLAWHRAGRSMFGPQVHCPCECNPWSYCGCGCRGCEIPGPPSVVVRATSIRAGDRLGALDRVMVERVEPGGNGLVFHVESGEKVTARTDDWARVAPPDLETLPMEVLRRRY